LRTLRFVGGRGLELSRRQGRAKAGQRGWGGRGLDRSQTVKWGDLAVGDADQLTGSLALPTPRRSIS
jgi:hypothetical protein